MSRAAEAIPAAGRALPLDDGDLSQAPVDGVGSDGAPRVALLGAFGLSHAGTEVPLSVPARRLLAFLALHDRAVLRDHVAEMLWLDSTQDRAAGSLRSALFKLRQATGCELVEAPCGKLQLAVRVVVDVREAAAWARRVLDPSTDVGDLRVDGLAVAGDILPDWYDDWVALERERFRELRLHALEALSSRLTSAERFAGPWRPDGRRSTGSRCERARTER